MQMTGKERHGDYLIVNPVPQPQLCRSFAEYHSESLGFLGVNLPAINNSVTAINYHNIRVVFVLSIHSDTSIFN